MTATSNVFTSPMLITSQTQTHERPESHLEPSHKFSVIINGGLQEFSMAKRESKLHNNQGASSSRGGCF
jgi:hypothetical protein